MAVNIEAMAVNIEMMAVNIVGEGEKAPMSGGWMRLFSHRMAKISRGSAPALPHSSLLNCSSASHFGFAPVADVFSPRW